MKRGISLVSLMITIVIILILISSITIGGFRTLNNNKKITFATEINMIQEMVDSYKSTNLGQYPVDAEVDLDLTLVTESAISQFDSETITDNKIKLGKIDYSKVGITSLKYGNSEESITDVYLVSETTGIVYYAKGLKINSMTYYRLTDDLRAIIGVNSSKESNDGYGITYTVSDTEWTKNKVITTVKVPSSYTNVDVSYLDTKTLSSDSVNGNISGNYSVYTIDNVDNNYIITVSYMKDGAEKTSAFAVNNVDNDAPVISNDSIKENLAQSEDSTRVYLNLNIKDEQSGIKQIKYALGYIGETVGNSASAQELADYFYDNGIKVKNNVIELTNESKYVTIYAEDNVGNFSATYYELSDSVYKKLVENENSGLVTPIMIKADPESYYGKIVKGYSSVSSDLNKSWQIFYSDGAHIYLISKDYIIPNNQDGIIDSDEVPNLVNGNVVGNTSSDASYTRGVSFLNAAAYFAGASAITNKNPVYRKLSYVSSYPSSSNTSIRSVCYMVDQDVWKSYTGNKADYAIGGPTAEQFIDSYNSVSHEQGISKLYYRLDENGYTFSSDNTIFSYDSNGVNVASLDATGYNNMYFNSNNALGMRIASPSGNLVTDVVTLRVDTSSISAISYESTDYGFRPIVCLSKGVNLEKEGDSFIVKGAVKKVQ